MSDLRPVSPPSGEGGHADLWPRAGWYPDPSIATRIRFWDGSSWSEHVAVARAATGLDEPTLHQELATFLDHLRRDGVDDPRLAAAVPGYVSARCRKEWDHDRARLPVRTPPPPASARLQGAEPGRPAAVEPVAPTVPRREPDSTPAAPDRTVPARSPETAPAPERRRPPRPIPWPEPSVPLPAPVARPPAGPSLWDRIRHAVVSDLTLHGLAYLGVLLVFAGIFGLLVFSWGEVGSELQPVAELAVPVALLGAGVVLTRRGSHVVGHALILVGGGVVPLVAIASVSDGSAFPPDARQSTLVACAAAAFFATAGAYAVVTARRPGTPLRFLVAPAVWLGVGMVALAARADEVAGDSVAEPSSGQVAAILVAVSATAWLARLRPDHRLSEPTLVVSLAGLAVFGLLAIVLGAAETWPLAALVVAAAAIVVGLEAVAPLLAPVVVGIGQVAGTGAAIAAIGTDVEPAWAAVLGVVALTALLEWEGVRRPDDVTLVIAATTLAVALAVTLFEPWASVAGFAIAAAWADLAHVTTREWLPAKLGEILAGVLPVGVAVGLFRAIDPGPAAVITATAVAVVAVSARVSRSEDPLLKWWVPAAATAVLVLPLAVASVAAPGWLAAAAALGVVAVVVAPLPPPVRIWLASGGLVEAGAFLSVAIGARTEWSAVALASVGAIAVVAARPGLPHAGHVGLVGHLATTAAIPVAAAALGELRGWPVSICIGLCTFGLLVTSWYQERGGAPAVDLLVDGAAVVGAEAEWVRAAIPALAVVSIPPAVLSAADSTGLVAGDHVRAGVILAAVGSLLAALTWPAHGTQRVAIPLEVVGVAAAIGGVGLAAAEPVPAAVAGVLLAATCLAAHPSVRWAPLSWIGWAATGFTVVRAADALGLPADRWCLAVLGWASVVLVGSLVADRLIAGPRSSLGWVRVDALLAPATLAAASIPAGLLPTYWLDTATWAWTSIGVAAVAAVVAWFTRVGAISGLSWVLLCVGAGGLAPFDVVDHPPVFVAAAFVMATASFVIERVVPRRGWASWDLPPLVVGTGVSVVGVAVAVPDAVAWTWLAAGALALAVAAWRREPGWAVAGVVLVNGAAVDAGRGWLTLSLAATSVGATVGAVFARGGARVALQLTGAAAAVGAFQAFLLDIGWMSTDGVLVTAGVVAAALVGGAVVGLLGVGARVAALGREWVAPWAFGAAYVFVQALLGVGDVDRRPAGLAISAGLLLAAAGSAAGAAPLRIGGLRDITVLLVAASASAAWWAVAAPPEVVTAILCVLALLGTGVWLIFAGWPSTVWRRPLAVALALAALGAPAVAAIGHAGLGWVTLGLATLAVVATATATTFRADGPTRPLLQMSGALAALGGVETFMVRVGWLEVDPELSASTSAVAVAALLGGGLLAVLGGAARWLGLCRDWVIVWSAAAVVLVAQAGFSVADAERQPAGLALAGGLTLAAVGAALAARPLDLGLLRESAAVLVLGATVPLGWALDARPVDVVVAASAVAIGAAGGGVWLVSARPGTPWLRPLDLVTGASAITAVAVAAGMLPERGPTIAALLVAAGVSAAIGVTRRVALLQLAVPPLLCASWLVYASDALRGEPLWFTVPMGLALLGVAAIGRHRHRQLGGEGTPTAFEAIEIAGCASLLLPPMVAMVTDHLAYALVAIGFGVALAAWGVITEVRRRLAAGVIGVVVTVVLLVGVPLVQRLSDVRPTGAALWLIVLGVGIVAIALAAALERGRTVIGRSVERLGDLIDGWE